MAQADTFFSEQPMAELPDERSLTTFDALYNTYAPALYGVILRITGNQTVSESILQQTFIEAWYNRQTGQPSKERIFTLMFKTARKLAVESLRSMERSNPNPDIQELVYTKETEDYLTGRNKTACIEAAARQALQLICFKAYTIEEAANELHIAATELKAKLKLAIEQLIPVAI